ncbi:UDP-glycosyltransferase 708C1-like [Durio zibethinus]|uniref:UDP-glycosyltransferase 708C1-like n=1 Tax=Durio zibethinus TaxID=66656 RepID=A0A6P5YJH3_DURZI|nr:UDP-glycosyltransferase 708C1-like [Durio zibethinus]
MSIFRRSDTSQPHIALFPSAGMGHLVPFLRLASMLLSHNCRVTLITTKCTVSVAESTHISFFLSTHPEIKHIEFQVPPMQPSNTATDDPFFIQFEATSRSAHLIHPSIASSSPPLSAIFSDLVVASGVNKVAVGLGIPNYVVSTTSVNFLSLMAYLPILTSDAAKLTGSTEIEIPGLTPLPISSIPPPFFNPDHPFTGSILSNARALPYCKGILMNTFDCFEPETLSAINNKRALSNLPPILPIGPLEICELKKDEGRYLPWLNNQPAESVVFVIFGSRTAMSKDQIKELRDGLEKSEYRFLWVLKTKKVDKDDKEDLEDLIGCSFLQRTKNRGMVLKEWVNQQDILAHPAIGGFVNHCGWNSVMEAAQRGIPVLAWPQHGDQRANAEVLEKAGLGIWDRTWGWCGQRLVKQDEIQKKISELMTDEKLKSRAKKVGEEARKATGNGGSSKKTITETIESLKQNKRS